MAKSRVVKKKSVPHKRSVRAVYNCDDVEEYLDTAISRIKNEIVPRIDAIDARDRLQYDTAKKIIQDANQIVLSRVEHAETILDKVEKDVEEVFETRKELFGNIDKHFVLLHNKIDQHISDETKEFQEIREATQKAASHVQVIQQTLDDVSANGKKGLTASFTDIYEKVKDVESATAGVRARVKFYTALHDVVVKTPFLKPLKYKWGALIYAAMLLLILNTVLHALGVNWDLIAFFKWLFSFIRIGG